MTAKSGRLYARLLGGASAMTLLSAGVAYAEPAQFSIDPQPLAMALNAFSEQSGRAVLLKPELAETLASKGVNGSLEPEIALAEMLRGTGLTYRQTGDTFLIVQGGSADPQSGRAAGDGASSTVEALIVTAQKREEDIQDVPIAISAFSQEDLTRSQVAGGPDLMTQVPNMTFTKTNFSSYSIQIRGIGTQAISATTDPAVAVAFNNTPFIRNRFFEQEFYDLQRVEVLRGPQGTLYGRNATAGVVNLISQKPRFAYEAMLSGDVANYNSTRLEGMINVPLVEDAVALRLAGAWTKRDGYSTNELTGSPIDGRDLWSTRLTLRFSPNDRLDANLIWEHFEEDDDRLRSGKQLCKTHRVTEIAGFTVPAPDSQGGHAPTLLSQGCEAASLYSPDSFQVPNGGALPYYGALAGIGLPIPSPIPQPYGRTIQSRDLRVIESTVDPSYRAKTDVVELQVAFDLSDSLSLTSETAWSSDFIFSTQDYNRFNTASGAWRNPPVPGVTRPGVLIPGPDGGIFCDPQIGCADRLVAVDLSTDTSTQFSQELRLGSNFDGPFNFSLGANFLRHDSVAKYYVFINSLTLHSFMGGGHSGNDTTEPYMPGVSDNRECLPYGPLPPDLNKIQQVSGCKYVDPNPIDSLNDLGHNYFLSKNPYKLISYAVFGEAYYNIAENLKVTAGLRWTVDKKVAPVVPSWILAADTMGHPVADVVNQEWREPTGRLTVDWKPDLAFTDETMIYASYAHGYKAGGANPPPPGVVIYSNQPGEQNDFLRESATHPRTFDAEFVDAFEMGAKNTFLDGRLTVNTAAFYYDYKGYQISQIINRSALNRNFDAEVWGLEIEADWRPLENLRLGFKGGYENTRVADGMKAVDVMDRANGGLPDENSVVWVVARPFPTFPSNCIVPAWLFVREDQNTGEPFFMFPGNIPGGGPGVCEQAYVFGNDPLTKLPYVPNPPGGPFWTGTPGVLFPDYPGFDPSTAPNNGEGIDKDLSGNELPNAPHFTATITADYTVPLAGDWLMTLHTDLYYQSEAWARIFNTPGYDKLKAYTNVNLAAIFTNDVSGWKVMAYVKNVFDRDSITGSFLNSDDTGLTTNIFLTEPRLYGLRVTKEWSGGPWWTGANPNHSGPYPLTIELGGQIQRQEAPYEPMAADRTEFFAGRVGPFPFENEDLDWGDGREVTVTFRPGSGPWAVSAGTRFGRTNGASRIQATAPEGHNCKFGTAADCEALFPIYGDFLYFEGPNGVLADTVNREEHSLIDFVVGRDVGFGRVSSTVKAGLRYAEFESRTALDLDGIDWQIQDEFVQFSQVFATRYRTQALSERTFEGSGPTLSWDASMPLVGNDETGYANLDWSMEAGVLFGKQETTVEGEDQIVYLVDPKYSGFGTGPNVGEAAPPVITSLDSAPRTKDVTVPTFGASVGLSYENRRIKVGAGYRWERYLDVLDAGFDEAQDHDRTIDGPYFKLSVGFGG